MCSVCRQVTPTPENGAEGLILNFQLADVIAAASSAATSKAAKKPKQCESCEDGEVATYRCQECKKIYCLPHVQLHQKGKNKDHRIMPIDPRTTKVTCKRHPTEEVKVLCASDNSLICMVCTVTDHHGHRCTEISQAYEEYKKTVEESLSKARRELKQTKQAVQGVKERKEEISKDEKARAKEIETYFQQLEAALRHRKKTMLASLTQTTSQKNNVLEAQLKEFTQLEASIINAMSQMESVLKHPNQSYVLSTSLQLAEQLSVLNIKDSSLEPGVKSDVCVNLPENLLQEVKNAGEVSKSIVCAEQCDAEGPRLMNAVIGTPATFVITSRNQFGKIRSSGGDVFTVTFSVRKRQTRPRELKNLELKIKDEKNGKYSVNYTMPDIEDDEIGQINVSIEGKEIKGSPFTVKLAKNPWKGQQAKDEPSRRVISSERDRWESFVARDQWESCEPVDADGGDGDRSFSDDYICHDCGGYISPGSTCGCGHRDWD